jgi:hypothetical protein
MIFAFAPIVGLLLGISAITVPWDTLITSVVLYIVIPVILARLWRRSLLAKGAAHFQAALDSYASPIVPCKADVLGTWTFSRLVHREQRPHRQHARLLCRDQTGGRRIAVML